MNTLPAFALAAEMGADGIEFDVWLCQSGEIVVLHDATVDHTTDGSGFVWDMSLADLKALDAGSWKDKQYAGARIPTLDEVFALAGSRFQIINVEIKSEPGMITGIEQAVARCITRHGLTAKVLISSFDPRVLATIRDLMPSVALGLPEMSMAFLEYPGTPPDIYAAAEKLIYHARHPHFTQVNAEYMARMKANGWRVNVWTVNDTHEALRLRALGVDGIMTDMPDVILAALR
jgi:glycerophosphoryl diester phosphodiesterase